MARWCISVTCSANPSWHTGTASQMASRDGNRSRQSGTRARSMWARTIRRSRPGEFQMTSATGIRDIFVQANGLRHHLLARGAPGTPVVMLIHGLTQQAHVFDGIAARLAESCHVYSLDVRGRGESE